MNPDSLEGFEGAGTGVKLALLAAAARTQVRATNEVREELRYMKRAFYGLIFSVLGGMILFLISIAAGWLGAHP